MTITTLVLTLLVTTGTEAGETSASGPILLDFTATWCGPCQSMRPAVEELHRKGYPIRAIDIDQHPELAERYGVTAVPTFVVVERDGRELTRQSGACAATDLATLYRQGLAKSRRLRELAASDDRTTIRAQDPGEEQEAPADSDPEAIVELPGPTANPWKTVVRIKVFNHYSRPASIGFGSGTIIHSTADEAIILTCAHIFKIEEMGSRQPRPDQFPLKVAVDLFDGNLRESPTRNRTPYMLPSVMNIAAEVIDYDYQSDVGLIRIKTGRPLPYAKVVPPSWAPQLNMKLTTLGCSEGKPATAWSTWVTNPQIRGQFTGVGVYQGTECKFPPKQGRSGGGLFTLEGQVAGVCNFNDGPANGHGLYAAPVSIHRLLAQNNLQVCWKTAAPNAAPDRPLLAQRDRNRAAAPRRARDATRDEPAKVLAQSPDPADGPGAIPMPTPEIMNVRLPRSADELAELDGAQSTRRYRWQPVPSGRIELAETEVRSPLPARRRAASARLRESDRNQVDLFHAAPEFDSSDRSDSSAASENSSSREGTSDYWRSSSPSRSSLRTPR